MKRQINISKNVGDARVEGHNVKLGRGGIREIEFFAQTQQLIAGGRDKTLRVRPTAAGAGRPRAQPAGSRERAATELTETYWFLRAVENRLQMLRDEQTHVMPETEEGVAIIATLMGYPTRADVRGATIAPRSTACRATTPICSPRARRSAPMAATSSSPAATTIRGRSRR